MTRRASRGSWSSGSDGSTARIAGFSVVPAQKPTPPDHIARWWGINTDIDDRRQAENDQRKAILVKIDDMKRAEVAMRGERTRSRAHHQHDPGARVVREHRRPGGLLQPALPELRRAFRGRTRVRRTIGLRGGQREVERRATVLDKTAVTRGAGRW